MNLANKKLPNISNLLTSYCNGYFVKKFNDLLFYQVHGTLITLGKKINNINSLMGSVLNESP